jgi:membrane protein DedA with SNARE-associated domain/rhodanese-related sulfurtransferase
MEFLIEYGYLLLFLLIFLDQIGVPLPSIPIVLAAGALAGAGEMSFFLVVLIAALACVPADLAWFYLGRSRGGKVLSLLCRISLEPDYCITRTEASFHRFGAYTLVVAKFVPGLATIAPPMAGLTGMSVARFLILDSVGAILWAVPFAYAGYLYSDELVEVSTRFAELGGVAAATVIALFAVFLLIKLLQRQLFLRSLKMRQLHPRDVNARLLQGESLYVVDLRRRLDFEALPYKVPGAVRVPMEEIEQHYATLPRDRDIILYCSCPNEASSARIALILKRRGINRVYPMTGGMESWVAEGFDVDAGDFERSSHVDSKSSLGGFNHA